MSYQALIAPQTPSLPPPSLLNPEQSSLIVAQEQNPSVEIDETSEVKADVVFQQKATPQTPPRQQPKATPATPPTRGLISVSADKLQQLRYAQSSMSTETGDGIPLDELKDRMLSDGFIPEHAIRTVIMSPSRGESPSKKWVAFDTRRTSAARSAAREDSDFQASLRLHGKHEPAQEEYEALRHLTFYNRKIPPRIRQQWIKSWHQWHRPEVLAEWNITPKTWGHLIKLRMGMSTDPKRKAIAEQLSGFVQSPHKRSRTRRVKVRKPKRPPMEQLANMDQRKSTNRRTSHSQAE